ncbi:flagellar hook-length control protein FliK [Acidovorax sp. Root267]|uniref:flagellar hook-length control protein FliK n=1 Tax=Acidovorax sp. Root267 TaxID=1736505 RepID=UPI000AB16C27|nr:flagellar hook-length control protein FliK [Acidovorax sp. Root267]
MEPTKISSSQGTQPAHAARPRSTAQASDANAPGAGGFLALMAALGDVSQGDGAPLDLAASVEPADVVSTDAAKGAMDASAMAAWQGLLVPGASVRVDAAAPEGFQEGGILRTGVQNGSTVGPGAQGGGVQGGLTSMASSLVATDGLPQGMVAETAMLDTSADLKEGLPQAGGTAHGRVFSRMQTALSQKADALEMSTGRSPVGGAMLQSPGHQGSALAAVQAASERMVVGAPAAGAADRSIGGGGDPAGGGVAASIMDGLLSPVASAQGGGGADGGARSGEGRSGAGAWFDSGGGSGPVEAGSLDGVGVFTDPAQAGAEEQVTEQVAYWVNQKTQNAELTLNRDGQPVEVSVSLSGNEAHVTFRSDQPQTRELLDRSMAQLSELLRSEGLVLSGMSVGTSAGQRGDAGGSERQSQRDGARQAQVVATAPAGTASLLRGGAADRAVDVFV